MCITKDSIVIIIPRKWIAGRLIGIIIIIIIIDLAGYQISSYKYSSKDINIVEKKTNFVVFDYGELYYVIKYYKLFLEVNNEW